MKSEEFCIIGQGLAGSLLALALLDRNQKVSIIDNSWDQAASTVAAGMWNPMNFKTMDYSWLTPTLIPFLQERFSALEKKFGVKFIYPKQILKKFPDQNSNALFLKKKEYLADWISEEKHPELEGLKLPNDSFVITNAGILDVKTFISAAKEFFIAEGIYEADKFDWDEIVDWDDSVCYISCEGYRAKDNPYFSVLPLQANKGEILHLKNHPNWSGQDILNCGKFLFRSADGILKAGSTYNWREINFELTKEAKEEILKPLKSTLSEEIEVLEQVVGIRPTVADRRPVLGFHPKNRNVAIFGGLGTKGVMLGPWFAEEMADLLVEGKPCNPEVDINRFKKRFRD